jgi:hypothetical protein
MLPGSIPALQARFCPKTGVHMAKKADLNDCHKARHRQK